MAVRGIGLEAEDADALVRLNQVRERRQLLLRTFGREMREENPAHGGVISTPGGRATVRRRAEPAEMQIVDARVAEIRRERRLGEARTARHRHCSDIHEQIDLRAAQRVEKVTDRRAFIADCCEAMHTEV